MASGHKTTASEIARRVAFLRSNPGLTMTAAASRLGCSQNAIKKTCMKHNIKMVSQYAAPKRYDGSTWYTSSDEQRCEIIRYIERRDGVITTTVVADEMGCGISTARKFLYKHGFHVKMQSGRFNEKRETKLYEEGFCPVMARVLAAEKLGAVA